MADATPDSAPVLPNADEGKPSLAAQVWHWVAGHQLWIRGASLVVACGGLLWIARGLPLELLFRQVQGWLEQLGPWGPLAFAGFYIVGTLISLPGLPMSILAGALFGVGVGFITVNLSAVVAATLGFLLARYLLREPFRRFIKHRRRLRAIDSAVAEGGIKVLAMLRLSPLIAFSLSNYLFGVTSARLRDFIITTWIGTMPGSLLYVYLGHAAKIGIMGHGQRTWEQWTFMIFGILMTAAATIYLTILARRQLRQQPAAAEVVETSAMTHSPQRVTAVTWLLAAAAVACLAAAPFADPIGQGVRDVLGMPPAAELAETYAGDPDRADFDHSAFDRLLRQYVSDRGLVDYASLKQNDLDTLKAYNRSLAEAPFNDLSRDEKLALLINAYNSFTLEAILEHYPVASIRDIEGAWTNKRWNIAGQRLSLDDIEHEQIRQNFNEPRIHFALVCAAIGCPPLRQEVYTGDKLAEQLTAATDYVHRHPRWLQYDGGNTVKLTSLYNWYGDDFEDVGGVLPFVAQYNEHIRQARQGGKSLSIEYLDYDWSLNDVKNRDRLPKLEE